MHIVICNERFVFRYGVDRVLIEAARTFVEQGWRVTFLCLRCEEEVVRAISPHLHFVARDAGGDLYGIERASARFLKEKWPEINEPSPVDAIISGGWPFFHVSSFGDQMGVPTLFIDAGSVPHDGLPEGELAAQRAVRRLRALSLPRFDRILPISDFIRDTQTIPDRGSSAGVHVVRLGVDHLAAKVFDGGKIARGERYRIERLERLLERRTSLILNLGRFEGVGYKNSRQSFTLLGELLRRSRDADGDDYCLLALGKAEDAQAHAHPENHVAFLGAPDDDALIRIMSLAHVGFSASLWEGFNLPIGEMHLLGKPVFAFNVGAHPEVALHPWFLCATIAEAAEKIELSLAGRTPGDALDARAVDAYREKFSWRRTKGAYCAHVREIVAEARERSSPTRLLFVDVSNSSRDTANSGVIRVTRRLSAELQRFDAALPLFVYWDDARATYRFVSGDREVLLGAYSGPKSAFGALAVHDGGETTVDELIVRLADRAFPEMTLLLPEVILDGEADRRIAWARRLGVSSAAVLYDVIPVDFPQYCGEALRETFPAYLAALCETDLIVAISAYSLERFEQYARDRNLKAPARREAVWLPGQLAALPRVTAPDAETRSGAISIVCVSTIEPRKNHLALLAAYRKLRRARPDLELRLTLIGNSYQGAETLAATIREAVAKDPSIRWRVAISDEEMIEEVRSAAFTIYPSLVEGFGLPILESLWAGRPCVCHDQGVMSELAAGGGCLTVDMSDADALAATMETMATDRELHARLSREARERPISNWSDYAREASRLLWPDSVGESAHEGRETAGRPTFRTRVERDAFFLRHRLNGLGLLGDGARTPQQGTPPALAENRPAAAARRRKTSWLARFLSGGLSIRKVRASGFFDAQWYLEKYPDVRDAGVDPLLHFVEFGHLEERSPGPSFHPKQYREENPDVDATGLSPFEHFLKSRGGR